MLQMLIILHSGVKLRNSTMQFCIVIAFFQLTNLEESDNNKNKIQNLESNRRKQIARAKFS